MNDKPAEMRDSRNESPVPGPALGPAIPGWEAAMAEMVAEMRAAGEANQRRLSRVERSRGAISQIRAKQETIRREIRNEIMRAAYALGVELSATDIQFTWDNHAAIAGMPAVEWLYEAAVTDGTEEAADEVIEKLSNLRQPKFASRIGLVVSE